MANTFPIFASPVMQSAPASGLLYHMARSHADDTRKYTPYQSLFSMAQDRFIQGQATKGFFARMEGERAVSFSGSRLMGLRKLVSRRSEFGICFEKNLIDPLGTDIRPVHYLERGAIETIMHKGVYPRGMGPADRYWIDLEEPGAYSFSWEQEWRKLGDFEFDHDSVVFLIAPMAEISAEIFALGYPIIPSEVIRNPLLHLQRVAKLVAQAREQAPAGLAIDEASIEDNYLVWLADKYSAEQAGQYDDFYPKIRAEMRWEEERLIYTESGELIDSNGEGNMFEASSFDLDNYLDEIYEDEW
ncbi:MAG: hypothetical protein WC683_19625 [bacterium]